MANDHNLPFPPFDAARELGEVIQVGSTGVQILIRSRDGSGALPFHLHVGSYVVLSSGRTALFGQLQDIRVRETADAHVVKTLGKIELFASIDVDTAEVVPGIRHSPQLGDRAFSPSAELVQFVVSGHVGAGSQVQLDIAHVPDHSESVLSVTPERLFGRHCAVLGATGGGKSWSLARMIEQSSRFNCKILLIDATGEYSRLRHGTHHLHFGSDDGGNSRSIEVSLPYYHLTEQDLFAIFRPSGPSQGPKLRAAMKSLKLAKVSSSVGIDGLIIKAHKPKQQYERSYRHHLEEIDSPYATFDIRSLTRQIENECIDPQRSSTEPEVWGGINAIDLANCMPLIGRIHDILQSPNLGPVFRPGKKPSLLEEIHRFIRDPEERILRINMQYLSFAHGARGIIAHAVARHLFQLSQKGAFLRRPFLVAVDEAHQFLRIEEEHHEDLGVALDAFGLIAKEGRKYSLNICIATQRPRDIPEDVLSQMGTMIVHRLINDRDRAIIERACGEVDRSSIRMIPTLGPGEAIMAGVAFPVPLHIKMLPPQCKPTSEGADFQTFWSVNGTSTEAQMEAPRPAKA